MRRQIHVVWLDDEIGSGKIDFGGHTIKMRPLSRERAWKKRRRYPCKKWSHKRVPRPMLITTVASRKRERSQKKKGQIVRVRSGQLQISSSMVVCVSVRFRVPTAPRPPSWPPRLVDEAGILETSRILRFASSCAASRHQAARHFFATIVQRNVCRGVRQARPLRASRTLPFGMI